MSKKTKFVLLLIYFVAFLMTSLGTAMAFFLVDQNQKIIGEAEVKSATETSTLYTTGEPLEIYATPLNFNAELKESLIDTTELVASLKKGTNVSNVKKYYKVEIVLEENTMQYSSSDHTAELVLTILDPNNREIETLGDLKHVKVQDMAHNKEISGFDITGETGTFLAAENYLLEASDDIEVKHVWKITLTFVNLNDSQDLNMGNGLKGYARISPIEEEDAVGKG